MGELDDTIRELRSSIFQLTVTSSTQSRRAMILDVCVDERAALGFDPTVRFDGPVDTIISNDVGDHLLAVLREALSNVAHHARATTVEVTVAAGAQNLVLRVEDNGIGLPADGRTGRRQRVSQHGGQSPQARRHLPAHPGQSFGDHPRMAHPADLRDPLIDPLTGTGPSDAMRPRSPRPVGRPTEAANSGHAAWEIVADVELTAERPAVPVAIPVRWSTARTVHERDRCATCSASQAPATRSTPGRSN